MKKFILNNIKKIIHFSKWQREFDDLKFQNGLLYSEIISSKLNTIKSLDEIYFKVFSQNNEDGIIDYLIKSLKIHNPKFIEIGTQDYSESNTRFLFERGSSSGLIIDGHPNLANCVNSILKSWKGNLNVHNEYIDSESISSIIDSYSGFDNVDLFSIDIDGIDYWILDQLKPRFSKILIAEYNPFFGPNVEITIPNFKNFRREKYHNSKLYWGMSLKALINLMKKKGYIFVGTNNLFNNAFFILEEYFENINLNKINSNNLKKFTEANYKEAKKLNVKRNEILNIIGNCEIIDLSDNNKLKRISELSI